MKAEFFLLGLCALGLAACSVDETKQVNDANSITFKATVPYATRAAATTANSLGSFSVWAWTGGATFMNHVTAVNNGSGTYTTSPLYFWPTTSVDFLGVSPAVDGTDGEYIYIGGKFDAELDGESEDSNYTGHVGKISVGETGLGGTILVDVPSSHEDQIDLCYAVATEQSSGSVAMNFRHALSQVVFAARTTSDEWGVEINGVSVCSVYKTGQYALPQVSTATNLGEDNIGTTGISDSQGLWTVGTAYSKASFHAGIADTTVPTDGTSATLTTDDGALFLIPQEVPAWDVLTDNHLEGFGSYFRINCKVTENGAVLWPNSEETADSDGFAEIAVPFDAAWEEGYKYTYTFVFGDGLGYYPPDDPNHNTDLDGTPVLVPISFTVSVDEFQKTEEAEVSTQTESITVHSAADLKAAIAAGYGEITVDEAIELSQGDALYFTNDCHLTLNDDLTYAAVSEYSGGDSGTSSLSIIIVGNGATLTIDADDDVNIASAGTNGTNGDDWVSCISVGTYFTDTDNYDAGHLIINGGNYKGGVWQDTENNYTSVPTIYIFCGDVEINGGNFVGGWSKWSSDGYTYGGTGWAANTLNCLDAPRKANTDEKTYAWFNVKGGSFREFNPANNASEGDNTNYVVDGYISTSSTGEDGFTWWTVTENN